MSEIQPTEGMPSLQQQKENIDSVKELFAKAHDLIANASHPGHMGMDVAKVLNFLKFHFDDFRIRGEKLAKQIEQEAKAKLNVVDVEAVKAATEAVLEPETTQEQPKAIS
jgi:hypothetical protein